MSFFLPSQTPPLPIIHLTERTWTVLRTYMSEIFQVPSNDMPRIIFHGSILAFIVCGFWLLDSLKDPVLASTIGMEYQPIAKIISVISTLCVVCVYDYLTSIVSKPTLFHIISIGFGMIMMILSAALDSSATSNENNSNQPYHKPSRLIGWIAYCATEAYGSLMVALFWSFTNSIMDLEQAKGAYGLIIAIAQIGSVLGSTFATKASVIGISQLYLIGAILIFSISLLIKVYHIVFRDRVTETNKKRVRSISEDTEKFDFTAHTHYTQQLEPYLASEDANHPVDRLTQTSTDPPIPTMTYIIQNIYRVFSGFLEGLYLVLNYSYVTKLLAVSCIYEIIVTVLDYQFKLLGADSVSRYERATIINEDELKSIMSTVSTTVLESINDSHHAPQPLNHQKFESNQFARLLGHFGQFTNIISFCVSSFGFSYMVHRIGVPNSLMIFPFALFIAIIIIYLVPSLWVLFISVSILKAMIFALHDPVKEILYIPTSEPIKFKAKAWIDVFGSRLAKACGSCLSLLAFGNPNSLRNIAEIPCILLSIVLLYFTWSIGIEFTMMIKHNIIVGSEDVLSKGSKDRSLHPHQTRMDLFEGVNFDELDEKSIGKGVQHVR